MMIYHKAILDWDFQECGHTNTVRFYLDGDHPHWHETAVELMREHAGASLYKADTDEPVVEFNTSWSFEYMPPTVAVYRDPDFTEVCEVADLDELDQCKSEGVELVQFAEICGNCGGKIGDSSCRYCQGKGWVEVE